MEGLEETDHRQNAPMWRGFPPDSFLGLSALVRENCCRYTLSAGGPAPVAGLLARCAVWKVGKARPGRLVGGLQGTAGSPKPAVPGTVHGHKRRRENRR